MEADNEASETNFTIARMTADIQVTILDHGKQIKSRFLIDLGVFRTLLSEEHLREVQADENNRKPTLKTNRVKLVPYGTSQNLEVMGRSK